MKAICASQPAITSWRSNSIATHMVCVVLRRTQLQAHSNEAGEKTKTLFCLLKLNNVFSTLQNQDDEYQNKTWLRFRHFVSRNQDHDYSSQEPSECASKTLPDSQKSVKENSRQRNPDRREQIRTAISFVECNNYNSFNPRSQIFKTNQNWFNKECMHVSRVQHSSTESMT